MVAKGEMIVKRIKILTLIICFVLLLAAISPMTKIEKTNLIAQVCIDGYRSEDYVVQVTDNGAIFAFRGELAFGPYTTDDGEFWFEKVFEAKSRKLTRAEYCKVKCLIENVEIASSFVSSGNVERSPMLGIYIGDNSYFCDYYYAIPGDEHNQCLAYNLVLISPIKSGSGLFNKEIIKEARETLDKYTDENGEIIRPLF